MQWGPWSKVFDVVNMCSHSILMTTVTVTTPLRDDDIGVPKPGHIQVLRGVRVGMTTVLSGVSECQHQRIWVGGLTSRVHVMDPVCKPSMCDQETVKL